MSSEFLGFLPKMDKILNDPQLKGYSALAVKYSARKILDSIRSENHFFNYEYIINLIKNSVEDILEGSFAPVINATGVILHTNLGRAPLKKALVIKAADRAAGYCSLEYELENGLRGDRYSHCAELLKILTGCEDAVIVNNNAAALFLVTKTLVSGGEAVVSRSELLEIGGKFRIPDVILSSGARLKEIGTVNKTYISDYLSAIGPETKLLMKISKSNFRMEGFVEEPDWRLLPPLAAEKGIPSYFDAGSGVFSNKYLFPCEAAPNEIIKAGFDLASFSGDKLLGSIQSGIIIGRKKYVSLLKKDPAIRMLRPDKLTLAVLRESLLEELLGKKSLVAALAEEREESLMVRTGKMAETIKLETGLEVLIEEGAALMGGGSACGAEIKGPVMRFVVTGAEASHVAAFLRKCRPPVAAYAEKGAVILSLRTVFPEEEIPLVKSLIKAALALGKPRKGGS